MVEIPPIDGYLGGGLWHWVKITLHTFNRVSWRVDNRRRATALVRHVTTEEMMDASTLAI
jgi:hypothetical protein